MLRNIFFNFQSFLLESRTEDIPNLLLWQNVSQRHRRH